MRTDYFSSGQRWFAFGIESKNGVNKNFLEGEFMIQMNQTTRIP
jgi:hypothetical protein